jgi:hypothetical protein
LKVLVFTQNPGFSGRRNAGRHSADFHKGVAQVDAGKAKVIVTNFGYLCPELNGKHTAEVLKIYGSRGLKILGGIEKEREAEAPGSTGNDEKVEVEFICDHKIGRNEFKLGDRSQLKPDFARGLESKGKIRIIKG